MTGPEGGWSNQLPVTQLVLPTGGKQVPGTGTVVIGGTLPAELSLYSPSTGIIWYSVDNTYRYYFLITSPSISTVGGGILFGYVNNAGAIHIIVDMIGGPIGSLDGLVYLPFAGIQANQVFVSSLDVSVSSLDTKLHSNGTDSYLSDNSGHVDTVLTFSGSGTGFTFTTTYHISYDRIVTATVVVTLTAALSATTFKNFGVVSPVLPKMTVLGAGFVNTGISLNAQLDTTATMVAIGVPALSSGAILAFSFTFPIAKPTF